MGWMVGDSVATTLGARLMDGNDVVGVRVGDFLDGICDGGCVGTEEGLGLGTRVG